MTIYRNGLNYRVDLAYKGNNGIYQKPVLSKDIPLSIKTGIKTDVTNILPWGIPSNSEIKTAIYWGEAGSLSDIYILPWGKPISLEQNVSLNYKSGYKTESVSILPWAKTYNADKSIKSNWEKPQPLNKSPYILSWSKTYRADAVKITGWLTITHRYEGEFYRNDYPYRTWFKYRLERRSLALDKLTKINWGGAEPKLNNSNLPWGGGSQVWGKDTELDWKSDTRPIDYIPPPEPEIKEFYNVATDLTVIDVETSTPLDVDNITISLDIDSFAWSVSARVLNKASMTLCKPGKQIKVTTMGYNWVFAIESYSSIREISTTWRITGASLSRALDAPYQDATSHIETTATTWKQAIESLLPADWSANYSTAIEDYSIPASAWHYNNQTPKGALSELLETIGAIAIPSRDQLELNIQPRYRTMPWQYNTDQIDHIIHENMLISESGEYRPSTQHNGVWVSGNTEHGVIVEVTRSGTDGQPTAADVYHELITDQDAGRQKGAQIIAASGNKSLITIETYITDEQASPGLIIPGQIIEVISSGETWRGLVLSNSISGAGLPAITQSVTIERDHGNYD